MPMEMAAKPTWATKLTRKQSNSIGADQKDPRDSAQVPPSVLAQHIGDPTVLHDDVSAKHAERHGSISHQEKHI